MKLEGLTPAERQTRMNVRNFLLIATLAELVRELEISMERNDLFRARCIRELIEEHDAGV